MAEQKEVIEGIHNIEAAKWRADTRCQTLPVRHAEIPIDWILGLSASVKILIEWRSRIFQRPLYHMKQLFNVRYVNSRRWHEQAYRPAQYATRNLPFTHFYWLPLTVHNAGWQRNARCCRQSQTDARCRAHALDVCRAHRR